MHSFETLKEQLTNLNPATREALSSKAALRPVSTIGSGSRETEAEFEETLTLPGEHAHTRWLVDDDLGADGFLDAFHCALSERCARVAGISTPKRIVIAGAGPAGLTTAIECAMRGHNVTVLEKHGRPIRSRIVGIFRHEERYLSSLGAPRSLRSEIAPSYADKSTIWLFDLIFFLRVVALKLGVVLYEHCDAVAEDGKLFARYHPNPNPLKSSCMTRRAGVELVEVANEISLPFDVVVDASGGHSSIREALAGKESICGLRKLVQEVLSPGDLLSAYLEGSGSELHTIDDKIQDCREDWKEFLTLALADDPRVFDDPICMVCSLDRAIFTFDRLPDLYSNNMVPPDWVWIPESRGDMLDPQNWHGLDRGSIRRVHLEGMFPREACTLVGSAWSIAERLLGAMGVDSKLDKEKVGRFLEEENSFPSAAQNTASFFHSYLTGVRSGRTSGRYGEGEYFIVGDAAQSAWFRFGIGVHDACWTGAAVARYLRASNLDERQRLIRETERRMDRRKVQVLFSIFQTEGLLSQHPVMRRVLDGSRGEASLHHYDGWQRRPKPVRIAGG
ncbi:NAD(P)-binding protein [uncultured Shewanella sp.]|uniref:NAD(P)-binding protein n=1 Tax=uncultured Shewanella sp. TaxID=173975 RepID=UPI002620CD3C|nr:NAD(P)-binding protein [uncultured Shewanella sp.]